MNLTKNMYSFFRLIKKKKKKNKRKIIDLKYIEHKEKVLKLVLERLEYYNTFYNFKYNRVSIKNQKTKWGSCSSLGNLNFNYKLLYLPKHLFDYVMVHELCHLGQMNHSKDFWNLVEKTIPDYHVLRTELKRIRL